LWQKERKKGAVAHPKYLAVKKLSESLLIRKYLSKNAKFVFKNIHFETNLGAKLKISASVVSFVRNLQLSVLILSKISSA